MPRENAACFVVGKIDKSREPPQVRAFVSRREREIPLQAKQSLED